MDVQFVIRVPRPSQVCDGRASPLLSIGVDREVSVSAGVIQGNNILYIIKRVVPGGNIS